MYRHDYDDVDLFSVVLFGLFTAVLLGSVNIQKRLQTEVPASRSFSLKSCNNIVFDYYDAFFAEGAVLNGILKPYFAYYRPSFHPWQHDNSALLQRRKDDFKYGMFSDIASEQLPKQECVSLVDYRTLIIA